MAHQFILDAPETLPYVDIQRDFDAPVEKLWIAHTDPAIVTQWIGHRVTQWDWQPGGRFAFEHDFEGQILKFWGRFHNIREGEFIAQTFEFEQNPDKPTIEFLWFESLGPNLSRCRGHAVYFDMASRNAMTAGDIDFSAGVIEGYAKLDAILAAM
jgi:uncharacterized protein YndB with AHSA1/START domain